MTNPASQLRVPAIPYTYLDRALGLGSVLQLLPLTEAAGTTASDASRNALAGTYAGSGVTYSAVAAPGVSMGSLPTLNGVAGNVTFSAGNLTTLNGLFNPNEFTFSIWLQIASGVFADANPYIAGAFGADVNNRALLYKTGANSLAGFFVAGGVTVLNQIITNAALAGSWHHLAVVLSKSGNFARCYLDGVQQGTDSTYTATYAGALATTVTQIGSYTSLLWWPGQVGYWDVRGRALFPNEVAALARAF